MNNKTISYYENNAENYAAGTVNADVTGVLEQFIACLPETAYVLDFGCGSGRDSRYLMDKGYRVDAIDGSTELCRFANEKLGVRARQMFFEELDVKEMYDGIWACSSILHLSKDELKDVFKKMADALKHSGIIYTSFKYGEFEGYRADRYFIDFTEEKFSDFLKNYDNITIIKEWVSKDVRPDRSNEKWLNLLLRKIL